MPGHVLDVRAGLGDILPVDFRVSSGPSVTLGRPPKSDWEPDAVPGASRGFGDSEGIGGAGAGARPGCWLLLWYLVLVWRGMFR